MEWLIVSLYALIVHWSVHYILSEIWRYKFMQSAFIFSLCMVKDVPRQLDWQMGKV